MSGLALAATGLLAELPGLAGRVETKPVETNSRNAGRTKKERRFLCGVRELGISRTMRTVAAPPRVFISGYLSATYPSIPNTAFT